jgi:autoinducer 2-degrading protein
MSKITLKGTLTVPEDQVDEIATALGTHIEISRKEPGCLVFAVVQDPDQPNRFQVYEEFQNQESFDAHQERTKQSNWARLTKNAIRNYELVN